MAARLLDGAAVAQQIRAEAAPAVAAFTARAGRPPGLGIVLVGDDPASEIYVRGKLKSAGEAGLRADLERLPATASLDRTARARRAPEPQRGARRHPGAVAAARGDGRRRRAPRVRRRSRPEKDVDGFHPMNVGQLVQNRATLAACTPSGVIELLERSGIAIAGARAVVIGRSDIVGKPMALLLLHRHATVTDLPFAHRRSAARRGRGRHPRLGDRPCRDSSRRRSSSLARRSSTSARRR